MKDEYHRVEDAQDNSFYRLVFENIHDPVLIIRPGGQIIDGNEAIFESLGYSREEMLGMNLSHLRSDSEKPKIGDHLENSRHGATYETVYKRKDGTLFPAEISTKGAMLVGEMTFICVIHDITERKQAEARLRLKKQVLEGINRILMETITTDTEEELGETCLRVAEKITQSKFGFIGEINEAGRLDDIAISNPGWDACRMANPIGHRVMPTGLKIHGIYGRVLQDGKALYTNAPATHPDSIGTPAGHPPITAFLGIPLLHFGKVVGMIGVANKEGGYNDNDTIALEGLAPAMVEALRRKRTEVALKRTKEQAELYVDLMGHDINNMNHSALGFLEIALDSLQKDEKLGLESRTLLEKPVKALQDSSALIDNVRKIRLLATEGIKMKSVDLSEIFRSIDARSFYSPDRDITINVQIIPPLMVEADDFLKDVFYNLISNAVKHSSVDRPLVIEVTAECVKGHDKEMFKCTVEDNGPGIPNELKDRIFYRFQRGATKARGKGLGLYLVRTLVEGYRGKVWVEDRVPGDHTQGAKFVITLPAANR